jgi:MFS family permease
MADRKTSVVPDGDNTKNPVDEDVKVVSVDEYEGVNTTFAAVMAKHKPNPFGHGYLKLYGLCLILFLNSTMSGKLQFSVSQKNNIRTDLNAGFDSSLMGSINTLPNYTKYYGLPNTGTASTGIVFAIFQVGQMVAALFIWMADWQGRKRFIFAGTVGVMVGTAITATARSLGVFIFGRFMLSFWATIACSATPLYLVEIAPPLYRGTVAGMYNTFYYFVSAF